MSPRLPRERAPAASWLAERRRRSRRGASAMAPRGESGHRTRNKPRSRFSSDAPQPAKPGGRLSAAQAPPRGVAKKGGKAARPLATAGIGLQVPAASQLRSQRGADGSCRLPPLYRRKSCPEVGRAKFQQTQNFAPQLSNS